MSKIFLSYYIQIHREFQWRRIDNMSYPTYNVLVRERTWALMQIEFYKTCDGSVPAQEFLDSLDRKMHAKMIMSIDLLAELGPMLRLPVSEPLGDGIFELKAVSGSNITRVLYFFCVGNKACLTNGFIKKTQKTPQSEI